MSQDIKHIDKQKGKFSFYGLETRSYCLETQWKNDPKCTFSSVQTLLKYTLNIPKPYLNVW